MSAVGLRGLWGHPQALRRLSEALARPVHAYLFAGPTGTGKLTAARAFAQGLVCESPVSGIETGGLDACGICRTCHSTQSGHHPDVRIWELNDGEKKFKVEQIRELIQAVGRKPFSAHRQVHILPDLETLTLSGANALLKTLEEPPPTSTLILLTRDSDQVLPTLLSRCQIIRFGMISANDIAEWLVAHRGLAPHAALAISQQANGRIGEALSLLSRNDEAPLQEQDWPRADAVWIWADAQAAKNSDAQMTCLDSLLRQIRDLAASAPGPRVATKAPSAANAWLACAIAVEDARQALQRHGNAKLIFDRLAQRLLAVSGVS